MKCLILLILMVSFSCKQENKTNFKVSETENNSSVFSNRIDTLINVKWRLIDIFSLKQELSKPLIHKKQLSKITSRSATVMIDPMLESDKAPIEFPRITNDSTMYVEYVYFNKGNTFQNYSDNIPNCKGKWMLNDSCLVLDYDDSIIKYYNGLYKDTVLCPGSNYDQYYILKCDKEKLIIVSSSKTLEKNHRRYLSGIRVYVNTLNYNKNKLKFDSEEYYILPYVTNFLKTRFPRIVLE